MKFTTEEIELSKKIAEKHMAEMGEGDWFIYEDPKEKEGWSKPTLNKSGYQPQYGYSKNILLWQISDCLEFLEKKGIGHIFNFMQFKNGNWRFTAEDERYTKILKEGKTRLAACLKAALAILEES